MQDTSIDVWCSKISKCIISVGDSIFHTLERGLRSKIKRVSRDCLIAISWLGCQISKNPDSLSNSASEIVLRGIEQFLHPGMELDERLLACMCMYNYASGKGIVLVSFSCFMRLVLTSVMLLNKCHDNGNSSKLNSTNSALGFCLDWFI